MSMPSDRKAAYTGLIVGTIALIIVVVTISKLTASGFDKAEGAAAATAPK